MNIVFLGTSSGTPTHFRNMTAVALCLEGEIILFDCAEGTQMQLKKAELRSTKISKIFISHMHGDHVNGLMGLLMSLDTDSRVEPLDIYGPPELPKLVSTTKRLLRTNIRYEVRFHVPSPNAHELICDHPDYHVESAPLDHRVPCWGYSFCERTKPGRFDVDKARELGIPSGPLYGRIQRGETVTLDDGRIIEPGMLLGPERPGRKVSFVTDTRPCNNGVLLAAGADVLIHEATFAEELIEKAYETGHSTATQAAQVASRSGVQKLLLTHFSTRYMSTSVLYKEAKAIFPEVSTAEDFMVYEVPPRPEPL